MTALWFKEGQVDCSECGEQFTPDSMPTKDHPMVSVTCPNGCRGSWASLIEDAEFCVPIERSY